MGYLIKQSATAQPLMFFMQDSAASRPLGKTGLSPTVTLSKNGGAFASPAGAVTEVANGWYKVAGNATDSATLGPLTLYATASGADPCTDVFGVVAYDPQDAAGLGLSRLDAAITSRMATFTLPTNFSSFSITAAGRVDVAAVGGTTQTARDLGASVLLSPGTGTGQLNITAGDLAGAVPSVTGSVGSVTGAVGSVTGAVGSVTAAVTVGTMNANTLTASALATDAVTEIVAGVTASTPAAPFFTNAPGGSGTTPPTVAEIAAAILLTPANLLWTDSDGDVRLSPAQATCEENPTSWVPGDCP